MLRPWQILAEVIRRNDSEDVADQLGVSCELIRQMRREPSSDEAPTSTGRYGWLDKALKLIDALILVNPKGAGVLVEYIHHYYLHRVKIVRSLSEKNRHEVASECLAQCTAAINQINNGADDEAIQVAILAAQDSLTRALLSLEEGK